MTFTSEEYVRVAIVGAGPAGIGAAIGLVKRGIEPIMILERRSKAGGIPAKYFVESGSVPTYVSYSHGRVIFGQQFVSDLLSKLENFKVDLRLESTVIDLNASEVCLSVVDPKRGKYLIQAEAILIATGAREQTITERGWISGIRKGRLFQTLQLLEIFGHDTKFNIGKPVVLGSDLIAYSIAAKLGFLGANEVNMIDESRRPKTFLPARLYFRRWVKSKWHQSTGLELVKNSNGGYKIIMSDNRSISVDADTTLVSGNLVPNSELLVSSGFKVKPLTNAPIVSSRGQLSNPAIFVTGNVIGFSHGGQRSYFNGLSVAKTVANFLEERKS